MPKRKARADGRYAGKIYIGNGKYKYVYGKTEKEVKDKLAELRVALNKGVDLAQRTDLAFWIDRFLAREKEKMTPEWYETCEARALLWKDRLGAADVTKITTADMEDVLLDLARRNPKTGKPSAKKTLTEYRNIIARVFAYAARNRVITFDPSSYIAVDKTAPVAHRDAITDAQIAAIHATPHPAQLACLIMLYAGLRLGELAALTWSDVDLNNGTILVNKSYNFRTGTIKPPKTAAGNRTVPIPPPLIEILKTAPRTSLLVAPNGDKRWTYAVWVYHLEQYSKRLGFPVKAHCLRHTCCTLYYEAGIDVLTAQHWIGHADPATTMGIYTHLRNQKEAANVSKLAAFFTPSVSDGCQNTPATVDK